MYARRLFYWILRAEWFADELHRNRHDIVDSYMRVGSLKHNHVIMVNTEPTLYLTQRCESGSMTREINSKVMLDC